MGMNQDERRHLRELTEKVGKLTTDLARAMDRLNAVEAARMINMDGLRYWLGRNRAILPDDPKFVAQTLALARLFGLKVTVESDITAVIRAHQEAIRSISAQESVAIKELDRLEGERQAAVAQKAVHADQIAILDAFGHDVRGEIVPLPPTRDGAPS